MKRQLAAAFCAGSVANCIAVMIAREHMFILGFAMALVALAGLFVAFGCARIAGFLVAIGGRGLYRPGHKVKVDNPPAARPVPIPEPILDPVAPIAAELPAIDQALVDDLRMALCTLGTRQKRAEAAATRAAQEAKEFTPAFKLAIQYARMGGM